MPNVVETSSALISLGSLEAPLQGDITTGKGRSPGFTDRTQLVYWTSNVSAKFISAAVVVKCVVGYSPKRKTPSCRGVVQSNQIADVQFVSALFCVRRDWSNYSPPLSLFFFKQINGHG